jgi:anti-sigma B factor antagonist
MKFTKNQEGTKLTYKIEGRLDTNTSPEIMTDFEASLNGITDLVIDLEKLEYISSAGVRALLYAYKVMKKQGKLVFRNVSQAVKDVLTVVGLLDFFTIE